MRKISFHRHATSYLRKMAPARRDQMLDAVEEVAVLKEVSAHPGVRHLTGKKGWYRLRVGSYRAVFQPRQDGNLEILHIDWIGPRGDAYR